MSLGNVIAKLTPREKNRKALKEAAERRRAELPPRICDVCGAEFRSPYPTAKYCGYDCRAIAHRAKCNAARRRRYRERKAKDGQ